MILWVDDDISPSRNSYLREFYDHNYIVEISNNPDEMWENLKKYRNDIELIIMDIMMPTGFSVDVISSELGEKTGLILLQQLKNSDIYKHIPILIFTVVERKDVSDWARQHGVKIIRKQDVRPFELINIIKEIVKNTNNNHT